MGASQRLAALAALALAACAGPGAPPPDDLLPGNPQPALPYELSMPIGTMTAAVDGVPLEVVTLDPTAGGGNASAFFHVINGRWQLGVSGFVPETLGTDASIMLSLGGGLPTFPEPGSLADASVTVQAAPLELFGLAKVVVEALDPPTEPGGYGRVAGRFAGRLCPPPAIEVTFLVDPCRDVEGRFDSSVQFLDDPS